MSIIHFVPVAGPTIEEAVESAVKMAKASGKTVIMDINDIVMVVTATTKAEEAVDLYRNRLNFKYEFEKMRRKMYQNTK